jgi:hypothetical protein
MVSHFELSWNSLLVSITFLSVLSNLQILFYLSHLLFHFFQHVGSKRNPIYVNSNLVQYLLQTDIQKRTEKIQWQIQTLHRDFSPGNPNRENQHILYSYIVLHCLQYNIHIGASGIQNPNPMTWISPKP